MARFSGYYARSAVCRPGSISPRTHGSNHTPDDLAFRDKQRADRVLDATNLRYFTINRLWRQERDRRGGLLKLYGGRVEIRLRCRDRTGLWVWRGVEWTAETPAHGPFLTRAAAIRDAARQCRPGRQVA